jgi:hypothetical protein
VSDSSASRRGARDRMASGGIIRPRMGDTSRLAGLGMGNIVRGRSLPGAGNGKSTCRRNIADGMSEGTSRGSVSNRMSNRTGGRSATNGMSDRTRGRRNRIGGTRLISTLRDNSAGNNVGVSRDMIIIRSTWSTGRSIANQLRIRRFIRGSIASLSRVIELIRGSVSSLSRVIGLMRGCISSLSRVIGLIRGYISSLSRVFGHIRCISNHTSGRMRIISGFGLLDRADSCRDSNDRCNDRSGLLIGGAISDRLRTLDDIMQLARINS